MSTQKPEKPSRNIWLIAVLLSIGLNGLLLGLLLSGVFKPDIIVTENPPITNSLTPSRQALSEDPRKFMRALPIERRKQVMVSAFKNLNYKAGERPGQLFRQLRRAERRSVKLLKAENFDLKAIEKSLAETREIKHKLAISGDAMIIEVLNQLTEDERKDAVQAMKNRRPHRKKLRRQQNRPR